MARPKGDIDKSYVGLRMDDKIISEVDKLAEKEHISRSQVIVDAVSNYLNSNRCVICGAVLPSNSKFCPSCGNFLLKESELFTKAQELINKYIADHDIPVGDMGNGFSAHYPVEGRCDEDGSYNPYGEYIIASLVLHSEDEVFLPVGGDEYRYIIPIQKVINEIHSDTETINFENGNSAVINVGNILNPDKKIDIYKCKSHKH